MTLQLVLGKLGTMVTNLSGWSAAQDPRVDEPCEFHVGNVTRGAVNTLEVPDCFGTGIEKVSQMIMRDSRDEKESRNGVNSR